MNNLNIKFGGDPIYGFFVDGIRTEKLKIGQLELYSYENGNLKDTQKEFYDPEEKFIQMKVIQTTNMVENEIQNNFYVYYRAQENERLGYIGTITLDDTFSLENVQNLIDTLKKNGETDISSLIKVGFNNLIEVVHSNFSNKDIVGYNGFEFNIENNEAICNKIITKENKNYLCLQNITDEDGCVWNYLYVPYQENDTIRIFVVVVLQKLGVAVNTDFAEFGLRGNFEREDSKLDLYDYNRQNFYVTSRRGGTPFIRSNQYENYDTLNQLTNVNNTWPLTNKKYNQAILLENLLFSLDGTNFYHFIPQEEDNYEYNYNDNEKIHYIPPGTLDIAIFRKFQDSIFKKTTPMLFSKDNKDLFENGFVTLENCYIYQISDKDSLHTFSNNGDIIIGSKNYITINILNNNLINYKKVELSLNESIESLDKKKYYVKIQNDAGGEDFYKIAETQLQNKNWIDILTNFQIYEKIDEIDEVDEVKEVKEVDTSSFNGIFLAIPKRVEKNLQIINTIPLPDNSPREPFKTLTVLYDGKENRNFEIFSKGFDVIKVKTLEELKTGFKDLLEDNLNLSNQIGLKKRFNFTPVVGNYYADYENRTNFKTFDISNAEFYSEDGLDCKYPYSFNKNSKFTDSSTSVFQKKNDDVGFLGLGGYIYGKLPMIGDEPDLNEYDNIILVSKEILKIEKNNNNDYDENNDNNNYVSYYEIIDTAQFRNLSSLEIEDLSNGIEGYKLQSTDLDENGHYKFSKIGESNPISTETINCFEFKNLQKEYRFMEIPNIINTNTVQMLDIGLLKDYGVKDLILPKVPKLILSRDIFGNNSILKQIRCYPQKLHYIDQNSSVVRDKTESEISQETNSELWIASHVFENSKITSIDNLLQSYSKIFLGDNVFDNSYLQSFNDNASTIVYNTDIYHTLMNTPHLELYNGESVLKDSNGANLKFICGNKLAEILEDNYLKTSKIINTYGITRLEENCLLSGNNLIKGIIFDGQGTSYSTDVELLKAFIKLTDLNYIEIAAKNDFTKINTDQELKSFNNNLQNLQIVSKDTSFNHYDIFTQITPKTMIINTVQNNSSLETIDGSNLSNLKIFSNKTTQIIYRYSPVIFTPNQTKDLSIVIEDEINNLNFLSNLKPQSLSIPNFRTLNTDEVNKLPSTELLENLDISVKLYNSWINTIPSLKNTLILRCHYGVNATDLTEHDISKCINNNTIAVNSLRIFRPNYEGFKYQATYVGIEKQAFEKFYNLKDIYLDGDFIWYENKTTPYIVLGHNAFFNIANIQRVNVTWVLKTYDTSANFEQDEKSLNDLIECLMQENEHTIKWHTRYSDGSDFFTINKIFPHNSTIKFCYKIGEKIHVYRTVEVYNISETFIEEGSNYSDLENYNYMTLESQIRFKSDEELKEDTNEQ